MILRKNKPSHSTGVQHQTDYKKYKTQLATDFNHRCGYCDDRDMPRSAWFEIDHFVPQSLDSSLETKYDNLIYACRSCNNSKSNKWPTGNKSIPNNGKIGWVNPCTDDYAVHFERSADGKIIPKDELGTWMHDNLKLWRKQHELLWNYDQLEQNCTKLESHFKNGDLPEHLKDQFIKLLLKQKEILQKFYSV